MDILIVFLVIGVVVGGLIVKAFERRQDVLYGPYIKDERRR
jgi:hypothetical protein